MNILEEHPIIMVWLDHKLRSRILPVATLDTLLQMMVDEYKITPEEIYNIANSAPSKRLKHKVGGLPHKPATRFTTLDKPLTKRDFIALK